MVSRHLEEVECHEVVDTCMTSRTSDTFLLATRSSLQRRSIPRARVPVWDLRFWHEGTEAASHHSILLLSGSIGMMIASMSWDVADGRGNLDRYLR